MNRAQRLMSIATTDINILHYRAQQSAADGVADNIVFDDPLELARLARIRNIGIAVSLRAVKHNTDS